MDSGIKPKERGIDKHCFSLREGNIIYLKDATNAQLLSVFGNDYNTADGTGVRDYIHVVDLAIGHLQALKKLQTKPGLVTYNLGTGIGYSVLDMVKAFEKACGKTIAYQISPRRPGDIAACYADPSFAAAQLDWRATHSVEDMASSSWKTPKIRSTLMIGFMLALGKRMKQNSKSCYIYLCKCFMPRLSLS